MNSENLSHSLIFSADFWPQVARRVLARETSQDWTILIPTHVHARLLRVALADELQQRGVAAMRLPSMQTPADWLRTIVGLVPVVLDDLQRRIALFDALRHTEWLAHALGESGGSGSNGGLWALARQLMEMGNELTWAAALRFANVDQNAPQNGLARIEQQLRALIRQSYNESAWKVCSPEAELVLGLWRVALSSDGTDDVILTQLRGFEQRLREKQVLPDVLAITPQLFASHERALLERYAQHARLERIELDVAPSLHPALKLAWPECLLDASSLLPAFESNGAAYVKAPGLDDLRTRASALKLEAAPLQSLKLLPASSLEDEAVGAAQLCLDWLAAGRRNIALVAMDRVVARRVRALLERAEVLVQDETGWKLSTSSAAGMLMRWLKLAGSEPSACESSVLLDWLKSPFVWSQLQHKPALLACIETALRRNNVMRGWDAMLNALNQNDVLTRQALGLLEQVRIQSRATRGRQTLERHFLWLHEALNVSAMRIGLQADSVGRNLLTLLDQLTRSAQGQAGRYGFTEWRELVADALENTTFRDSSVQSPVVFCSLAATRLRSFEAVIIVGADAKNFAVTSADSLFLTPGLRAELGLRHRDAEQQQQLLDLALLLSSTPQAVVSWQSHHGAEPNPLAPPLERLALVHQLAFADDLRRSFVWPLVATRAVPVSTPAPRLDSAASALMPGKLSASAYERFISCPYRYFVQSLLGLTPLDEVTEDAEKRDYGELLHRILQTFHAHPDTANLEQRAALIARLEEISQAAFAPLVQLNGDYLAWRERWLELLPSYVDWLIHWRSAGWRFAGAEVKAEVVLGLGNGQTLTLHGRIDRFDQRGHDADGSIAIIDYKAKAKYDLQTKLKSVGEDVQLPFYRLLLPDANAEDSLYLSVDRSKVEAVRAEQNLHDLSHALEQRIRHDFARLAQGAALPANGVDAACQYCDARGLCRKGHWSETPHE